MIATTFEIRDQRLIPKLIGAARSELETDLAGELAESLRCIQETRFLDWEPKGGIEGRPFAGFLRAYLNTVGSGQRYSVQLLFEFAIRPTGVFFPINSPGELEELYSTGNQGGPGKGGFLWKQDIVARFEKLRKNQEFGKQLAQKFSAVPLAKSDDLLLSENPKAKMIAIPIRERDLEAKNGTEMTVSVSTPDETREEVDVETKRCVRREGPWEERVQCRIAANEQAGFTLLRNRRHGYTTIRIKKYEWDYGMTCAERFDRDDSR